MEKAECMSRSILGIVSLVVLWLGQGAAQSTNARLSGSVSDPDGAVIAGAAITIENTETGITLMTTSNEAGAYRFPSLQPGIYRLTSRFPRFQTVIYTGLAVQVSGQ